MFIVLWVILGGILGTCAAWLLLAGLQLGRKADVSNSSWQHALHGEDSPPGSMGHGRDDVAPATS